MAKTLLIVYYSQGGKTKRMAENIKKGAEDAGAKVNLKKAEDCTVNDLVEADGLVIGSPTYFSNVAWQIKKLIDESIAIHKKQPSLENRVGGSFTSAATNKDGKDCLEMMELAFGLHHKMNLIPGILVDSSDGEAKLVALSKEYGARLVRQLKQ